MGKRSRLSDTLVTKAQETLLGLPGVVEVRLVLEPLQDGSQFDALLEVVAGRHQVVRVPVEVQARGYPQNVRQAANRLAWHRNRSKAHAVTPLLIAPSLSPGSRKLLQDLDVGYWDSGGSLYLKLNDSVFLVDRPAPPVERRRTRGLFRGASAQVLHQLLLEPGRAWRGNELAEKAGVSAYTVHLVLQYLEEQLLVERDEKGPKMLRSLQEPGALLEAWAVAAQILWPHRARARWPSLGGGQGMMKAPPGDPEEPFRTVGLDCGVPISGPPWCRKPVRSWPAPGRAGRRVLCLRGRLRPGSCRPTG